MVKPRTGTNPTSSVATNKTKVLIAGALVTTFILTHIRRHHQSSLPQHELISAHAYHPSHIKPVMKFEELSVIGERNSGTRWTVSHLTNCFGHALEVREKLVRHKHWFQHDVPNGRKRVGTLVVAQFRDPFQWFQGMMLRPHHSPMHCCKRPWKEFLTTPWTMERLPSDLALKEGNATLGIPTSRIECQEYFNYDQINSCQTRPYPADHFEEKPKMSGHQPQYEMRNDGSGNHYNNIMELRSDKIVNFLSIADWDWVQDFVPVQYEELLERGTAFLVDHIQNVTGIQAQCEPFAPQPGRKKYKLSRGYVEYVSQHLNWDTEALVGYENPILTTKV